jgi:hypothetical protein
MIDPPNPARARAEAMFKPSTPEERSDAMSEYRAGLEAARQRMAEQRAARLAKERWQAQRLTFGAATPVFRASTSAGKR